MLLTCFADGVEADAELADDFFVTGASEEMKENLLLMG